MVLNKAQGQLHPALCSVDGWYHRCVYTPEHSVNLKHLIQVSQCTISPRVVIKLIPILYSIWTPIFFIINMLNGLVSYSHIRHQKKYCHGCAKNMFTYAKCPYKSYTHHTIFPYLSDIKIKAVTYINITVKLPQVIMWNGNLMQQGNFIDVFLAQHVSGT